MDLKMLPGAEVKSVLSGTAVKSKVPPENTKLRDASRELEATFISYVIKSMEKTLPDASLTGSKNNLAKMMFSTIMGKEIANQGGLGMSNIIYEALREREANSQPTLLPDLNVDVLQHVQLIGDEDE